MYLPVSLRKLAITGEGALHDSGSTMQNLSLQATGVIREDSGLVRLLFPADWNSCKDKRPMVNRI